MEDVNSKAVEMNRKELTECLTDNVELTTTVAELEQRHSVRVRVGG